MKSALILNNNGNALRSLKREKGILSPITTSFGLFPSVMTPNLTATADLKPFSLIGNMLRNRRVTLR